MPTETSSTGVGKSSWWIAKIRRSSSSGRSWSSTRKSTKTSERPAKPCSWPDDENRGRLLAAPVTSGCLRCVEAVEQALDERPPDARLERLGQRVHGFAETRMLPCAA